MSFWESIPMANPLLRRDTINANDTLGAQRWIENQDSAGAYDNTFHREIRLYNDSGGALVKGQIVLVQFDAANVLKYLKGITPAAVAAVPRYVAVAQEAIANGAVGWFAVFGYVDALVNGTTDVAANDYLKVVPGTSTTAFIKDGAAQSTSTQARSLAASTADSDNTTRIFMIGDPAII